MQPDEVRIHDTREWIARSREDLDMAAFALTPKPPFLRDCLFHSQQAGALASARKLVAEVFACLPSEVQSSRPGTVRDDEPTTT
jgi:hypothetical protein